MPRPARLSLLALALALSLTACSDSSGPDHIAIFACESGSRYAIGQTVKGVIRTTDCTDVEGDGTADFYQFQLPSAGPVAIALEPDAGSVPISVMLLGSSGEFVAADLAAPGEIERVGGQLEAGTYVIVVSTNQPGTQSSYTLSSNRGLVYSGRPFQNCNVVQPYAFGTTVSGTLAPGDCIANGGSWMDLHRFTLASARTIWIDLMSEDVDAYLFLFDAAGAPLAARDDGGRFRDARLFISLPAGTYSIGAAAFDLGVGTYTLRTQPAN